MAEPTLSELFDVLRDQNTHQKILETNACKKCSDSELIYYIILLYLLTLEARLYRVVEIIMAEPTLLAHFDILRDQNTHQKILETNACIKCSGRLLIYYIIS